MKWVISLPFIHGFKYNDFQALIDLVHKYLEAFDSYYSN